MVYLNAANNLEPFGIEDMNEMESVGSTRDVNIVVECARFRGKQAVKPNSGLHVEPVLRVQRRVLLRSRQLARARAATTS